MRCGNRRSTIICNAPFFRAGSLLRSGGPTSDALGVLANLTDLCVPDAESRSRALGAQDAACHGEPETSMRCIVLYLSLLACSVGARAEALRLVVGGIDKQIYLPLLLADRLG